MVNYRTENIRCILCNKHLDITMQNNKELFICSECQAYFCPDCLAAIRNYRHCPAARLLGVNDHEPKFLKILPPKPSLTPGYIVKKEDKTVKILPRKKVKIIDKEEKSKEKESRGS